MTHRAEIAPSMTEIVEGDISMVEELRATLARSSRAERRRVIRAMRVDWLRMAVVMSEERWKDARQDMLSAARQVDAQVAS